MVKNTSMGARSRYRPPRATSVLVVGGLLALAGCATTSAEDDRDASRSVDSHIDINSPSAGPTSVSTPERPVSRTIDAALADRGLSVNDIRALASVATQYGYGLSKTTPLDWDQSLDMAYVMVGVCDDVNLGEYTWEDAVQTDIVDGAPESDARGMNSYLRDDFCSHVRSGVGSADSGSGRAQEGTARPTSPPKPPPRPACPAVVDVLSAPTWTAPVTHDYGRRMTVSVTATNPAPHPITVTFRLDQRRPGQELWDPGVAEVFFSDPADKLSLPTLGLVDPFELAAGASRTVTANADFFPPPAPDHFRVAAAVVEGKCKSSAIGDMSDYP